MLQVDWTLQKGWDAPKITAYGDLKLDPACSVFHYGLECFEGMKAYKDAQGKIRLFRPDKNMERMNNSMKRLQMPTFDGEQLLECIKALVKLDGAWIPEGRGFSLYLSPTGISTQASVGEASPEAAKIFVINFPVGPYYKGGFNPIKLLADPQHVRAWPGGVGNIKCGGNYAMGMAAQNAAAKQGFAQILWLYGDDYTVTEVGTMNQFFFWTRKDGVKELITAPLDGTILPGVTRDSILQLTREYGEFEVTERQYTMTEIIEAVEDGRMIEAFGAGTAAIVSPVESINFLGKDYQIPVDAELNCGKLAHRLAEHLMGIQYGEIESDWSVVVE
jgi:branched-chain amino acid aminotransferase